MTALLSVPLGRRFIPSLSEAGQRQLSVSLTQRSGYVKGL